MADTDDPALAELRTEARALSRDANASSEDIEDAIVAAAQRYAEARMDLLKVEEAATLASFRNGMRSMVQRESYVLREQERDAALAALDEARAEAARLREERDHYRDGERTQRNEANKLCVLLKRQRESLESIDATPDDGYVSRILQAHLDANTRSFATDNLDGKPPTDPVIVAINEASTERAALLGAALERLQKERP